jgi:hypothetical protein
MIRWLVTGNLRRHGTAQSLYWRNHAYRQFFRHIACIAGAKRRLSLSRPGIALRGYWPLGLGVVLGPVIGTPLFPCGDIGSHALASVRVSVLARAGLPAGP